MTSAALPLLIEPEQLESLLGSDNLLLVDLCKDTTYAQLHIPGAVHLSYATLTASRGMTHGLLPEPAQLEPVLSAHGMGKDTRVVAYDDEGGGNACRLFWTLETMGHQRIKGYPGSWSDWGNRTDTPKKPKALTRRHEDTKKKR